MAHQPTKSRKFMAGTVTAALVATAIVPTASAAEFSDTAGNTHEDAINALSDAGVINGYLDGTFQPNKLLSRSDVVKMMGKWLVTLGYEVPADYASVQRFDDVSLTGNQELLQYAALVKEQGVFNGNDGKLDPTGAITRENMALVLVRAYDAINGTDLVAHVAGEEFDKEVTDLASAKAEARPYIDVLDFYDITTVASFNPKATTTRGQFASFLYATSKVEAPTEVETLVVTDVVSVDSTTMEVTFEGAMSAEKVAELEFTFDPALEVTAVELKTEEVSASEVTTTVVLTTEEQVAGTEYSLTAVNGTELETPVKVEVPEVVAPEVTSVSAINAKTLSLNLSKEITSIDGLTFTVKRGDNTIVLASKLSEDKKSVELSSASNLVAGDYTVTVTGGEFKDGSNSAVVKVESQKVSTLTVLADQAVLTATTSNSVTVGYSVKDQYGTDITKEALASNVTWSSSMGTASDNNEGKVTVNKGAEFKKGDTFVLTGVNGTTGTTVVANLTVSDASALSALSFGDIKYPTDKTRVEIGLNPAAHVELTGVDQYGNAITSATVLNASTTIISSDVDATATFETVNGKTFLKLETVGVTSAKTVVVTVVIKSTGEVVNYSFDVVKAPEAAELTIAAPTTTIASGDGVASLVSTLDVKDQFGSTMTAKQIANNTGAYTITSSNSAVIASNQLAIAGTGDNAGKLVNTAAFGAKGSTTITVTVNATGKSASFVLDVKDARVASTVELPTTLVTNLVQGASVDTKLMFKDQYAKAFDATSDIADRAVKISIAKVTGDDAGLSLTADGQTTTGDAITITNESNLDSASDISLNTVAGKKGSYTVTFQYVNTANNNEVLSQVSKTFVVAENVSTGLTYSVSDVSNLYKGGSAFAGTTSDIVQADVDAGYAQELKITATDANGNAYVIPSSSIVSVTSNKGSILVDKIGSKWYVAGGDSSITADVAGQVSVVINTNDGVKTIVKNVTVSSQSLVAQSVEVKDLAAGNSNAVDLSAVTISASATTFDTVQVWVTDQFGGYTLASDGFDSVQLLNITGDAATGASYSYSSTTGVTTLTGLTTPTAGEKFRVILIEDGKSDFFDITLN